MKHTGRKRDVAIFAMLFGILVSVGLGHYALWDDEANTALFAQSVWEHGIPRAELGENIIAFRHGVELTDGVNRFMPPMAYYIASPFVAMFGRSTTGVRLPFALMGIAGATAAFAYVRRLGSHRLAYLFGFGMLCNVSLLLYVKQARYYSLVIALTIFVCLAYLHREKKTGLGFFTVGSFFLLLTHYLAYAAVIICLMLDYALWGHREKAIPSRNLVKCVLVQLLLLLGVIAIMQPFGKSAAAPGDTEFWHGKLLLMTWTVRDMNRCEFGFMGLTALVPILFVIKKADQLALRLSASLCCYVVIICFLSPQPMGTGYPAVADVRYMIATIPLLVLLSVHLLSKIKTVWVQVALAVLVFGTNALHLWVGRLWGPPTYSFQSTPLAYAAEVMQGRKDPYSEVTTWLRAYAPAKATVASFPGHTLYPLMWHAPNQIYAWQFLPEQKASFRTAPPPIHFRHELAPDFLIGFGLGQREAQMHAASLSDNLGAIYEKVDFLPVHFPESYRPEFYWRVFENPEVGPEGVDGVVVFRKLSEQRC